MSDGILTVQKKKKVIAGLFTCDLDLHIAKATVDFKWTGPKIKQSLWWEICSFFEWTYATEKSESQVRLYVNSATQEWGAWAFPQKKGTGMTTEELPEHANWADGMARFPAPDWYYWGTVHHHCSTGAFQSGTDESNEREIEGLHITVGKIGSNRYDIDCRIYQMKWKLTVNMAEFWDVGPVAKLYVPEELYPTVARHQMCQPPPKDYAFPEEWKANYIAPPPPIISSVTAVVTPHWSHDHTASRMWVSDSQRLPNDMQYDLKTAAKQLMKWLKEPDTHPAHTLDFAIECLQTMEDDALMKEMTRLMWLHDVSPGALLHEFEGLILEEEANDAQKERQEEEAKDALAGEGGQYPNDGYPEHGFIS